MSFGAVATAAGNLARDSEPAEALHPSWVAKRQQKDMLAAAPRGTRVVFGDDGDVAEAPPAATVTHPTGGTPAVVRGGLRPHRGEVEGKVWTAAWKPELGVNRPGVSGASAVLKAVVEVVVPQVVVKDRIRFRAEPAPDRIFRGRGGGGGVAGGRGQLHPSWEAKKLQRKQMEHLPKPEGVKVIFEDSD